MAKSDNWTTPPDLAKVLNDEFFFLKEVCAEENNRCYSPIPYISQEQDALKVSWASDGMQLSHSRAYCNPPYSKLPAFVARGFEQALTNQMLVAMLIPVYTDTKYWDTYIDGVATEVRLLKGRLRFWENGKPGKDTARFPSALVVWDYRALHKDRPTTYWIWDWRASLKS